jgi:hypothetical protein
MKAISLWQPWASLIMVDAKRYETRSWATAHRGPLLIHAAKTRRGIAEASESLRHEVWERFAFEELPFGALIGVVQLVEVLATEGPTVRGMLQARPQEAIFGNFEPGRFAWELRSVRAFAQPIPYRGQQGLFEVPECANAADYAVMVRDNMRSTSYC